MRNSIIVCIFSLWILSSCNQTKNPIVFEKKTDESTILITLDKNKTFDYNAKSTKGVAFHEKGTYTVKDSVIILDYTNAEYSYNCYTIPLPNDTLLFVKYNDIDILFPIVNEIPGDSTLLSKEEIMKPFVNEYNCKEFKLLIGNKYFVKTKGDVELIYEAKNKISKYYDQFIK